VTRASGVQDNSPPPGYRYGLYCCHDSLSAVTERRKACMPYEGTLDFPVLFLITAINFIALVYGATELAKEGELISLAGTEQQNVKMIALVFALVETTPGFLFLWCVPCRAWTAQLPVPLVRIRCCADACALVAEPAMLNRCRARAACMPVATEPGRQTQPGGTERDRTGQNGAHHPPCRRRRCHSQKRACLQAVIAALH
jgi:hypothetical protein